MILMALYYYVNKAGVIKYSHILEYFKIHLTLKNCD